jgi:hypothetical protein
MDLRIADTSTDSVECLTGGAQKVVMTAVLNLQARESRSLATP